MPDPHRPRQLPPPGCVDQWRSADPAAEARDDEDSNPALQRSAAELDTRIGVPPCSLRCTTQKRQAGARRLEPHPPHRQRHRRRGRPTPTGRPELPQRHRHRSRRLSDPAEGPLRQRDRALPTRRRLTRRRARVWPKPAGATDRAKWYRRINGLGVDTRCDSVGRRSDRLVRRAALHRRLDGPTVRLLIRRTGSSTSWDVGARDGGQRPPGSGRRCSSVRVPAKRSPCSSTRASTAAMSNDSGSPSAAASTSSQLTGVDTVGRGRARSE